ncbi:MAG: LptF/LptG family permease [Planctomycetaceae bacterium]|nr:LptF/LptG family permease [Planctomycetaceae bacterium]
MNALTRTIIMELCRVFMVALFGLTSVIMLVFVVQDMLRESLTPLTALQLVPYALPGALIFAIPATILFAVCTVYGRMAADNEIVAVKALGISPWLVIRPAVIFALALSFVTVYLTDVAVPWGRTGMYRVVLHSVHHTIYGALRTQRAYQKGPVSIRVDDVAAQSLIRPVIELEGKMRLVSATAQLDCDPNANQLVLVANNGELETRDAKFRFPHEFRESIALEQLIKKTDVHTSPAVIPSQELPAELANQMARVETLKTDLAQLGNEVGVDAATISGNKSNKQQELEQAIYRLRKLQIEGVRRWAGSFSCLAFAVVGAAVAIRFRFSDSWSIFLFCFVPILVVYYPILAVVSDAVRAGKVPPMTLWLSNLVTLGIGLAILRSVLKN